MTLKLTMENQCELIPDSDIKDAFLQRGDIQSLPPDEQETRWREHLIQVNKMREMLSGLDAFVINVPRRS